MRRVTVKPPKMLMLAIRVATKARTMITSCELGDVRAAPSWSRAPTTMMPLIALVTDISGVCRAWWTLPMT